MRPVLTASVAVAATLAIALAACAPKAPPAPPAPQAPALSYPDAAQGDVVDTYFDEAVADPYRWLEDPDSPETRAWIEAENTLTRGYLDQIPQSEAIQARLTDLWNYERFSTPWSIGGRTFFYKNDGLQPHAVLYTAASADAPPSVLLDPNTFSDDGTRSLGGTSVSWDGAHIAYAVSDGGSDWRTWRIRDIETGEDLDDVIEWSKFSGASWAPDSSGFYYSRYPAPENPLEQVNENQQVWFHRLGTAQSEDTMVYADPDHPTRGFGARVSEDGTLLWLGTWEGTEQKNRLHYWRIDDSAPPVGAPTPFFDAFDAEYSVLANDGDRVWVQTNRDAPKSRVVSMTLDAPEDWTEIIPESDETLRTADVAGDTLFGVYLKDAHTVVRSFTLDGASKGEVTLPGVGSASGFGGMRDATETWYSYSDFTTPSSLYRYDLATGESALWKRPDVDFDSARYVTEQVFIEGRDGTRFPLFITRRSDITPTGDAPTILYGYGGFNIPITPGFRADRAVWLEMGGVYVVANIRGGGEYGEDWHEAGTKMNKQNVFDDFIAAGEWLVANDWTRPDRLAINGRSNGGLLVGAVMTQRPDLFGAALPGVGVLDMLRYHTFTIGWAWASDYGRSDDSPEMFSYLKGYSPLHSTRPGTCYPATLVHTADHDDRVVPGHSFKFTAALQRDHACDNPVLIRIETRAGHGAGMSTEQRIREATDLWAFLVGALDFEPQLPMGGSGGGGGSE